MGDSSVEEARGNFGTGKSSTQSVQGVYSSTAEGVVPSTGCVRGALRATQVITLMALQTPGTVGDHQ